MRNGLLATLLFVALVSVTHADESALQKLSANDQAVRALIERLETRIAELEAQVKQLKLAQQSTVLGGRLLESVEEPIEKSIPPRAQPNAWQGFKIAVGSRWMVDPSGVIRERNGRKVGHWGIDITPDGSTR